MISPFILALLLLIGYIKQRIKIDLEMATDESTNERPSERRRDENEWQITCRKAEEMAGVGEGDIPERALKGII